MSELLTVAQHDRDSVALSYVYPVVSRRAQGVSVGINLNINNACNWRCIYCQVPNLKRGGPGPIDLALLEQELTQFLVELLHGDFMEQRVPEKLRRINDIALSGNGEPTSCQEFEQVIDVIARVRKNVLLPEDVKTILITNGSLMQRKQVQAGLRKLALIQGEVWFKFDRASEVSMAMVNDISQSMTRVKQCVQLAASLCPTWLQTCWFALDGAEPALEEISYYIDCLEEFKKNDHSPLGVMLYGLARESHQPEASRLSNVVFEQLQYLAEKIKSTGFLVKIAS